MSSNFDEFDAAAKPKRSMVSLLLVPVAAFIAGIAAMGWLLTQWTGAASMIGVKTPPPASAPAVRAAAPTPAATPAAAKSGAPETIVIDPEISRRVTRLEAQIADIDNQARQAVGTADRAEGLLVAFAARRALDRGVGLGYIEGLLRQRFGQTQPQAVATIITAAREPVTLQELQEGLQDVTPTMLGSGPEQSWWDAIRGELANLIIIRKAGTPSPIPAEGLRRATRQLEAGEVDVALAEVLRLPGRQNAADWIGKASRYVRARRALDTIETAALLEPRLPVSPSLRPQSATPR